MTNDTENKTRTFKEGTALGQICHDYTDLSDRDIDLLEVLAGELESLGRERGADVFIDCLCRDHDEAIVVAEYLREDSPHKFSTIGYIAREENEAGVLRSLHYGIDTHEVRAVTRAESLVIQSVKPIKRGRSTIGVLVFEKEHIEEEMIAELSDPIELKWSRPAGEVSYLTNLEWAGNIIDDILIIVDSGGTVVYRNNAAIKMYRELGYVKDIIGMPYREISLNDPESLKNLKEGFSSEELVYGGHSYILRQFRIDGDDRFWAISLHDITALKQHEQLQRMKEAMLREVQHRTKNNLNMIYSLLAINKRKIKDKTALLSLNEAMGMILSLSVSYEDSLRNKDEGSASLFSVITSTKNNVLKYADSMGFDLKIDLIGDDLTIDVDKVASIALVINEALFNSCKHAFKGRSEGLITIEIHDDPITPEIVIKDNGIGFKAGDELNKNSNGLKIMRSVVEDSLRGKLAVTGTDAGTVVRFNFIAEKGGAY